MAHIYGLDTWVNVPVLDRNNSTTTERFNEYVNDLRIMLQKMERNQILKFKLDEYSGHIITEQIDGHSIDYMVGSLTKGVHLISLVTSVNYGNKSNLTKREIESMLKERKPIMPKKIKVNETETYEYINVALDPVKHPIAYNNRVNSLIRSGMSTADAKKEALLPIEMEIYFDQDTSLIMIDSGAMDSGVGVNPYTGVELEFEE